jgi:hypothetical protein
MPFSVEEGGYQYNFFGKSGEKRLALQDTAQIAARIALGVRSQPTGGSLR